MMASCGCQFDAAGNVFVDHCVCPPSLTEYPGQSYTLYIEPIDRDAFEDELASLCERHSYRHDNVGRWTFGWEVENNE